MRGGDFTHPIHLDFFSAANRRNFVDAFFGVDAVMGAPDQFIGEAQIEQKFGQAGDKRQDARVRRRCVCLAQGIDTCRSG